MFEFSAVIPTLVYRDLRAAHDFMIEVFGFESVSCMSGEDGVVYHAEVQAGHTSIWLHRVLKEHDLDAVDSASRSSTGHTVYVDNVDLHYERASASGAKIDYPPKDQPYGREYGVRDLEGHRWWFIARTP